MTREEAKAIIRKEYLCVDRDCDIERSCGTCDLMMPSKEPILRAYGLAIKALEYDDAKYHEEHGEVIVDKGLWEDAKKALEQEPCDKCVYSTKDGYCQYDDITETIPPFEPCEDTISRQAVLKQLKGCLTGGETEYEYVKIHIDSIPPVTPQKPKWIPVSERLPIIETDVLLTSWSGKQQFVGWIDAYGKWHADEEEVIDGYEPLAWMPLPPSYQGE